DFLLRMTMPHQVAARVVMSPGVLSRFIAALRENVGNYQRTFQQQAPPGVMQIDTASLPAQTQPLPSQQSAQAGGGESGAGGGGAGHSESMTLNQNSVQDLYDQLKMQDEMLSGSYANAVMIGHTATEFSFDFITTF